MIAAVVADDFTGANDCAGSFAQQGFSAFSARPGILPDPGADVAVCCVESRFMPPREALRASRSAWMALSGRGRLLNYQRMDSTLRGNPGQEILGLLEALQAPRLAFCAAFPLHGRHIQHGVASVRGTRLDESEYARDPLTPSKTAEPLRLFPRGLAATVGRASLGALRQSIRKSSARILCFDASEDADLRRIAKACLAEGIRDFAGSSGLSSALAGMLWGAGTPAHGALPRNRAVLAGSVSQTTLDQLQRMHEAGAVPWMDMESGSPQRGGRAPLGPFALSSLRQRGQMRRFRSFARARAFGDRRMRALVRHGLELAGGPEGRLWLLTGGHCAEAFYGVLGLRGSWVKGMLVPGIPLMQAVGGEGLRIWACSKPGGFGDAQAILNFMRIRRY
jgi:uncharacterized protein YgbK (DUF1537 family)